MNNTLVAKFFVAGMAATAVLFVAFVPTTSSAITLRDELAGVLTNHPRLKAEKARAEAAQAQVRRAFSGYLPKLSLTGDIGPEMVDSPANSSATRLTRKKATLTFTQNVFDGYRTPETYQSAQLREVVARQRLERGKQLRMRLLGAPVAAERLPVIG